MSKIEDRDPPPTSSTATPVATGIVSVGDAWACSNPSLGRGASIGLAARARAPRPAARRRTSVTRRGFAARLRTPRPTPRCSPWFLWTRRQDRQRIAEIDRRHPGRALRARRRRATSSSGARSSARRKDPDLLRPFIAAAMRARPARPRARRPGHRRADPRARRGLARRPARRPGPRGARRARRRMTARRPTRAASDEEAPCPRRRTTASPSTTR